LQFPAKSPKALLWLFRLAIGVVTYIGHVGLSLLFSLPCVVSERDWYEESGKKGILFDKARIVNLFSDGLENEYLQKELKSWAENQVSELYE
jgi:hypothetical protein